MDFDHGIYNSRQEHHNAKMRCQIGEMLESIQNRVVLQRRAQRCIIVERKSRKNYVYTVSDAFLRPPTSGLRMLLWHCETSKAATTPGALAGLDIRSKVLAAKQGNEALSS